MLIVAVKDATSPNIAGEQNAAEQALVGDFNAIDALFPGPVNSASRS
ncbi:MAG: hypothetical protein ACREM8_00085 [Vulcanimicrobiaceae bacterium]